MLSDIMIKYEFILHNIADPNTPPPPHPTNTLTLPPYLHRNRIKIANISYVMQI